MTGNMQRISASDQNFNFCEQYNVKTYEVRDLFSVTLQCDLLIVILHVYKWILHIEISENACFYAYFVAFAYIK